MGVAPDSKADCHPVISLARRLDGRTYYLRTRRIWKEEPEQPQLRNVRECHTASASGEMLQKQGGFQMKHVPYKGTSASVTDVLGGQISLVIGTVPALESHAKSGKVKLLGVTSEKRSPLLPDVPAISETYPGFDIVTYFGLTVPKNTPAPVIATLNGEINKVLSSPEMKEPLTRLGVVPVGGSPSDFKAKISAD
jgi:tripartite-type tricarboxylate transporter receptor subunit TctC